MLASQTCITFGILMLFTELGSQYAAHCHLLLVHALLLLSSGGAQAETGHLF